MWLKRFSWFQGKLGGGCVPSPPSAHRKPPPPKGPKNHENLFNHMFYKCVLCFYEIPSKTKCSVDVSCGA